MPASRRHLLLAGTVVLMFGIGMGLFLRWAAQTPRRAAVENEDTPAPKPPVEEEKKPPVVTFADNLGDFGKVEPPVSFAAEELPTLPESVKTEPKPAPVVPIKEPPPKPIARIDNPPKPPAAVITQQPLKMGWILKAGDQLMQELIVSQQSAFSTQGLTFNTNLKYSVVSRFVVDEATNNGVAITQRIEGARLIQADGTTQGLVLPALAKMPGTRFRMVLGPDMRLRNFVGAGAPLMVGGGAIQGGFGLQTASLMDLDGWREMAQATFFQPAPALVPKTSWTTPMSHNWGPLGGWLGETLHVYTGRQGATHQFGYGHRMKYVPPRGGGAGMPFQVAGAAFQPRIAEGSVVFDSDRGRVVGGQERFRVVGRMNILILGLQSPVEIDEDQHFQFRILDAR